MRITPITLDFETLPIEGRPAYPPVPVSFSLKLPGQRKPQFYSWGHLTGGNNCNRADAARVLKSAYAQVSESSPLLCHHAKFDTDVSEIHFGLALPPWHCLEDTMFLLFLEDPHQRELGLKPSAERLLGMKPDEQDAVKQWVLDHKKQLEADFPEIVSRFEGIKPSNAGSFIAYVPGNVVEPYANGDVTRTEKLFVTLRKSIEERGMLPAYNRERQVMPILLRNEREGLRVDTAALERDQVIYEAAQLKVDDWIRKALKSPTLDLDKDRDVAEALFKCDAISEWTLTPTGQRSVSKKNMKLAHFRDQKLAAAYSYRQKAATSLETFIRPWRHYSHDGIMRTSWNQVRQAKGGGAGDTGGTRTGRPSSDSPNFLNMPKKFSENGLTNYKYPAHIAGLPHLPVVRKYIIADAKGYVFGRRDFNQQELRLLAHYEDGMLLRAYQDDNRLDVHDFVQQAIRGLMGIDIGRPHAKILNFGYVYGQGLGSMAEEMWRTVDEVKSIRDAQMGALPGLKELSKGIKLRSKQGLPIVTWGGREYYAEEPREVKGWWMDFIYKLLNYLIQGSAADVTKESIIRYDAVRKDARFALTVYDENNICGPKGAIKQEMLLLREAMLSIETDVPLLSDAEVGPSLGALEKLSEPLPNLSRWN